MQSRKLAVGLAVVAAFMVVDSALAYYNPSTGRFLGRDPIGEPGAVLARQVAAQAAFIPRDIPGGEPNLYRYVKNRPLTAIDPVGLSDQSTTQPTTQSCHYCGPNMTAWFADEINIHAKFWRSTQRNVGVLLRPLYFKKYASLIPYKWTTFETERCPACDQCKGTVMLCGVCIHKSELGNIMYGAMAKL